MESIDLFKFVKGGVYCIRCLKNNKLYIGESGSLLERAARHFTLLKAEYHECLLLQKDFCLYGSALFKFEIICFEEDFKKRRSLENNLINKYSPNQRYNITNHSKFDINKSQLSQQVSIDGEIYNSIRQAEKFTKISKSTIIRRLNNKNDLTCTCLKKQLIKRGKYYFIIDEIYYLSTHEVVNNNLAKNDNQVTERCRSNSLKWKNWQMIQKKRSNDYPDGE